MAAPPVQLFSAAQLVGLYRSLGGAPTSQHSALEQGPAISPLGSCLPGAFSQPASGKYDRRDSLLPPCFSHCYFVSASSSGAAPLEVLPFQYLFRSCRSFLSQPLQRSRSEG